jgi:hypothetical protein
MGDHGIEVDFGRSGRHRAESRDEIRVQTADLVELLELLAVLRSGLGDGARSGGRAGAEREGRHSADRSPAGPRAASTGRHAAERVAPTPPVTGSGRHRAPGTEADPVTAGGVARGGLTSGAVMNRWSSVAAIVERATRHETPVSVLVRETSVPARGPAPVRAVRGAATARRIEDDVAERWAAEHWIPTQRRSEPDDPGARPVGWHPVPRPRHSTADGPVDRSVSGVVERLAG